MITKKTIEENSDYEIRHYTGYTEFGACSCSNDCDCKKDFIPQKVEHYTLTVIKHTGKRTKSKTFYYSTLEQVNNKLTNTLKMNKTKLTYADIEQIQYVLNAYVAEFHGEMGDSYKQALENLKFKLIVVRAQMEQEKIEQN